MYTTSIQPICKTFRVHITITCTYKKTREFLKRSFVRALSLHKTANRFLCDYTICIKLLFSYIRSLLYGLEQVNDRMTLMPILVICSIR